MFLKLLFFFASLSSIAGMIAVCIPWVHPVISAGIVYLLLIFKFRNLIFFLIGGTYVLETCDFPVGWGRVRVNIVWPVLLATPHPNDDRRVFDLSSGLGQIRITLHVQDDILIGG